MTSMKYTLFLFLSVFMVSCNQEKGNAESEESFNCNLRISKDPGRINPFFAPTSAGREIFQYIFLPLADFHPDDLELEPILITKIPETKYEIDDDGNKLVAYDIEFRKDAQWSDGKTITNRDYLFTVQAIKHPLSKALAWKSYFDFIVDVKLDSTNNKKLTVYMDGDYMLSKETALTTCIMPAHVFDPENKMKNLSVKLLLDDYEPVDTTINNLIENINNSMNDKTNVVQIGPYKLIDYQTDLYVVLEKVKDYWGAEYKDNPYLQAYPEQLIFNVVPDEVTAITMAKESKLDFVSMRQSNTFLELKEDTAFNKNWSFHVPQIMMFYYIAINNKSKVLSDKTVRKALAYLADVDDYIENIDGGLGVRTSGYFHPTKSYYNESLPLIEYNPEKAKELLNDAGWRDTNGNGILDKGGKELELDILITGSQLSKNIALLFQESAKAAGIKVGITAKKSSVMRKENLYVFNYDLAALAISNDAAPDDPFNRWHSENAVPGGKNTIGYSNPKSDKLIEQIRLTNDVDKRKDLFLELQEIMYEDQPAIYLYCPLQKIIINNKFDATTTAKRPGYKANTFKLAS